MSEDDCKRKNANSVGRCENCGTRHTHAATGCICYLCGGFLRLVTVAKEAVALDEPAYVAPASDMTKRLINELYARAEVD